MKLRTRPSLREIRILAVDDEPEFIRILERKLKQHSDAEINIETLTEPSEVLSKLEEDPYDALIVDYRMPNMNGLELLKAVREENNEIPFIIETSNYKPEMERKAYNNGATSVMRKSGEDEHYKGILRNVRQEAIHYRSCKKVKD